MWQVMISSAMGQNQYFHGIDWDEWKPQYVEPEVSAKKSEAIKRHITARNIQLGIETSNKVLAFVQESKKCLTRDIMKYAGLSDSSVRRIMKKLIAENKVEKKPFSAQFGTNYWWIAK